MCLCECRLNTFFENKLNVPAKNSETHTLELSHPCLTRQTHYRCRVTRIHMQTHAHRFTKIPTVQACEHFKQQSGCVLSCVHSSAHLHPFLICSRCSHPQTVSQGLGLPQTIITNNHRDREIRRQREMKEGKMRVEE